MPRKLLTPALMIENAKRLGYRDQPSMSRRLRSRILEDDGVHVSPHHPDVLTGFDVNDALDIWVAMGRITVVDFETLLAKLALTSDVPKDDYYFWWLDPETNHVEVQRPRKIKSSK